MFLKKKIVFNFPSKKKYLFYDYVKRYDCIIKARYEKINFREEINFFVLIFSLFFLKKNKFKLKKTYIDAYFFIVKPKIVFTFTDNDLSFYNLKIDYLNIKFISIQNGTRSRSGDIFEQKKNDSNLLCDKIYVHNKYISKEYQKIIKTKTVTSGSLLNNFYKKKNGIKYDLTFISQFESKENFSFKNYLGKPILWKEYYSAEKKVLKIIKKFVKDNNLSLNICARFRLNNSAEKKFYNNILKKDFLFSVPNKYNNQYDICDKSKLVVFIDSTLGYESISRGNKTLGFSIRNEIVNDYSFSFGWPKYFTLRGPSWISIYDKKTMYKLLHDNFFLDKKYWNKINKRHLKDLMVMKKNNLLNFELFK